MIKSNPNYTLMRPITSNILKNRIVWFLICVASITLLAYYNTISLKHFIISSTLHFNDTNVLKNKTILYWDTFHGTKDFSLGFGNAIFKGCQYSNCYATGDRNLSNIDDYDAIIFHGARYNVANDGLPANRSSHQKYIFFSLESAFNTYFDDSLGDDFYNWTFTFRRGSDIYYPYGMFTKEKTKYKVNLDTLKNKNISVAWFVSNCATSGAIERMKYVKELAKYIPIDIYGGCGNMTCNGGEQCYEMLEKDYFFYLSFENSFCGDYITEKLYNILKYDVIPVVRGAADYKTLAPPNSVINVDDFRSMSGLVHYLLYLRGNITEYSKYMLWKKDYVVHADPKQEAICQLCEKLNTVDTVYTSYKNIRGWHSEGCRS